MADVKITKTQMFAAIKEVIANAEVEGKEDMLDFIDKQVELIANKASKAKERAEKKKVEGDALRDAVQAVLTDELQLIDDIVAQVEVEDMDITRAKVTSRLTQLVKAGIAVRDEIKVDKAKKAAYALAETQEEDEAVDGEAEETVEAEVEAEKVEVDAE